MHTAHRRPYVRFVPTFAVSASPPRWLTLFVLLGGALGSVAVTRGLFDPDYFWHLATGRRILETRAIPTVEPFSFTWRGDHWIPDQWLGDVAIAALYQLAGGAAMLIAFGLVAMAGPALVAAVAPRTGQIRLVGVLILVAAVLLPQVTARPQVISFAIAGVLLATLMSLESGHHNRLWWLPGLFAAWANVHGYFIVGLAAVVVFAGFTIVGKTSMSAHRGKVAIVAMSCFLAAMLTPQGPGGLLYAASFMNATDFGTQAISEWQSPDFHSAQFLAFLGFIAVALVAGVGRAPGWMQLLAVAGICAGLFAARATGIGAILALPALLVSGSLSVPISTNARHPGHRWLEFAGAVVVAVVVVGAAAFRGPVRVDERRVPVAGITRLGEIMPDARVLADYAWGGYVISELGDSGGTAFVGGRMHKYRPDLMRDYVRIVRGAEGWRGLADSYGVEAILLPPTQPLVGGIAQSAGWCEVLRTSGEVLLLRDCDKDGLSQDVGQTVEP